MPSWGEILQELIQLLKTDPAACDVIRRKYLSALHKKTGRSIILYATKWTQPGVSHPDIISIVDEDIQGFMEVARGLANTKLDLILHSPGGSPVAAEAIVSYLRARFSDIRVIVPQAAMSAATMISCAANKIVMGLHSSLGPIDPQMLIPTQLGLRMVPAQAILDQFRKAQADCRDPVKLGSWMPILGQYGPALLVECENAIKLSKYLVKKWLADYMFAGMPKSTYKAALLARKLADHGAHMSHSRHLNLQQCKLMGFNIEELEKDRELQDLVLSIFHVTTHTFNMTPAVKIIENHDQKAFIKVAGAPVPMVVGRQPQSPPPTSPAELSPQKSVLS